MIGNDVVCLALAKQSKYAHSQRFLDKIFTIEEQDIIKASIEPVTSIWQLWAAKESAYKLWIQQGNQPCFSPQKIACTMIENKIKVSIQELNCEVLSVVTPSYIYTEALLEKACVTSNCFEMEDISYKAQSLFVKEVLKQKLSEQLEIKVKHLSIKKSVWGVPKLYYKSSLLPFHVSLSHHGNYGAYAIVEA